MVNRMATSTQPARSLKRDPELNGHATETLVPKQRRRASGESDRARKAKASEDLEVRPVKQITIPMLDHTETIIRIVGDRPLLMNNKAKVAERVAAQYSGAGKAANIAPPPLSDEEQYHNAFYVMPDSPHQPPSPKGHYGVPASGIKKCVCKAIRTTGITDNTTIGLLSNSFWVMDDAGGLCRLNFDELVYDIRAVAIGSGAKTMPQMRHRPLFNGWSVDVRVKYNSRVIGPEQLANLFNYAGQYIGLCELRAEKKQGMCGGFLVDVSGTAGAKRGKTRG